MRLKDDYIVALAVAAVGGFFFYQASLIEFADDTLVGPRLVPMLTAGMIIGLAALIVAAGHIMSNGRKAETFSVIGEGEPELAPVTKLALRRMASVIVGGFVYLFLFAAAGYLISTAVVLAALLVIFGNRPPLKVALLTIGGAAVYFFVFIKLMGIHSPPGWLIDLTLLGLG